ncbi:hypothetical protein KUH03_41155 [Sphingobacterium sp. E70]|uniref:hypothetical protein n=1 Tax=Sphingobacterium sp. E70 TaxID=2853439 RepID=UPI00211BD736|nr:hypothetical protein [Sphingobacterium sp. E70]ULT25173.1 hypothetical protein KUH03_41155 [Sphingobacterium sp. E70]
MKKIICTLLCAFSASLMAQAQQAAPQGFDVERKLPSTGKIDSLVYPSKTVGVTKSLNLYASRIQHRKQISGTVPLAWNRRR